MRRILFILLFVSYSLISQGQNGKNIVQLSGLVIGGDSAYGIPGVTIYTPKSGRGTITNYLGYFSMPALGGDSIVIKSLGFKEKSFIVPKDTNKLSLVIELLGDTSILPTVEVFPWPTEKIFKEAFLSLKLDDNSYDNMHKNLNEQVMRRMLYTQEASSKNNHNYYMQQQTTKVENRFFQPTLSLLNPFAWSQFLNSARNGGLRNKKKEENEKYGKYGNEDF
ncbi:MAG: carboxypeptidase-like regulatory domain-containing protein [Sporocytophaga sp.]|uniref:carboxypeptidase-like regulatory domain-containing protein n=1 Tax=Sporocytophaga sp. TaxID=2231183 RepID=UPI001B24C323|nr:carboxypeptidase-like regulatory domain-containing protein [Sporocytophaga sp.]MBO9699836.1 carboxypeptidase-like regulatory domain-containing protein [Sporocytophaga sp.]